MCQVNGKAKISTPQRAHSSHIFQPILMKLETKKRYPGCHTTGKIWLMWDDEKGVCAGRAFFVTFCVLSFFVFLLTPTGHTRREITTVYGSKRVFPRKVGPFGVLMIKSNVRGSKLLKNNFLGLNKHLKSNMRNFRIAISRKVRTRSTRTVKGNFRCTNRLRGWSSITKL